MLTPEIGIGGYPVYVDGCIGIAFFPDLFI
jgi:hypothetical protein